MTMSADRFPEACLSTPPIAGWKASLFRRSSFMRGASAMKRHSASSCAIRGFRSISRATLTPSRARPGCRRIEALAARYGVETLEMAFEQIFENTAEIFRREILPKIRDGVYHFEDYIEADGVDAPRLHTLRLTMTKTPERVLLDFTGTDPEAKGPIN